MSKSLFEGYRNVYIKTESSPNFTSIITTTAPYKDAENPLLLVLASIMENEYLHTMVRVELGTFEIISYRDPKKCLEAFQKVLDIGSMEDKITDEMVDRAVMKVFSSFDAPEKPSEKGRLEFSWKTEEVVQRRRDAVFNATKEQMVKLARKLREKEWRCGMFTNPSVAKQPDGHTAVKLTE